MGTENKKSIYQSNGTPSLIFLLRSIKYFFSNVYNMTGIFHGCFYIVRNHNNRNLIFPVYFFNNTVHLIRYFRIKTRYRLI